MIADFKFQPDGQDALSDFAAWLDTTFPASSRPVSDVFGLSHQIGWLDMLLRISYSEDMAPGGKYLRVWHLGFRTDFGLPGMADPYDMATLMELVCTAGLLGMS